MHERVSMLFFRRHGRDGVARSARQAVREQRLRRAVHDRRVGGQDVSAARTSSDDDGFLYKYDYNPNDLPYYFEYKGADHRTVRPVAVQAGNQRIGSAAGADRRHDSDGHRGERCGVPLSDRAVPRSDEVHQARRHRNVSRRRRRLRRQLRDEQLLSLPARRIRTCSRSFRGTRARRSATARAIRSSTTSTTCRSRSETAWRSGRSPTTDLRNLYFDTLLECARVDVGDPVGDAGDIARHAGMAGAGGRSRVRADSERRAEPTRRRPYTNEEFQAAVDAMRIFAQQSAATFVRRRGRQKPGHVTS